MGSDSLYDFNYDTKLSEVTAKFDEIKNDFDKAVNWFNSAEEELMGGGGAGGLLPDFFFFFSCSADHERDWPPCEVVFFGLATNALNVKNNKQQTTTATAESPPAQGQ